MELETLRDLLTHELKDIYDAEHQITEALPKMATAAKRKELKSAFTAHLEETRGQITRLEKVFEALGEKAEREPCAGMKGLITEGNKMMKEDADPDVMDAALIAAAQKVEHYEIASYGTARTYAAMLGDKQVCKLLQQTLDEEGETDKKLTAIAEGCVNRAAEGKERKAA